MDTATFHVVPAAIADQIGSSTLWELACCTGLAFIGGPGSNGHTDKVYRAIPGEDPVYERTRLMHKIASPTPLRQDAIDFIVDLLTEPLPATAPPSEALVELVVEVRHPAALWRAARASYARRDLVENFEELYGTEDAPYLPGCLQEVFDPNDPPAGVAVTDINITLIEEKQA